MLLKPATIVERFEKKRWKAEKSFKFRSQYFKHSFIRAIYPKDSLNPKCLGTQNIAVIILKFEQYDFTILHRLYPNDAEWLTVNTLEQSDLSLHCCTNNVCQ